LKVATSLCVDTVTRGVIAVFGAVASTVHVRLAGVGSI
jgi:hypothetical protein